MWNRADEVTALIPRDPIVADSDTVRIAVADVVADSPVLLSLRSNALRAITQQSSLWRGSAGSELQVEETISVVVHGQIIATDTEEVFIRGDFLGESCVIADAEPRHATYLAEIPSTVLRIPSPLVRLLAYDCPSFAQALLRNGRDWKRRTA